ncbi:MAG: hypothetical protein JST31_15000, partial [Actinobacteria bacterium]|nr:hypothetical protein [Actinomycetota bacterium]
DSPGLGGGLLSAALELTVTDVTAPAAPLAVYSGPLASMPAQPAGRVEPGAARTYEFVATLPAGGGQNAVQGASVSVAYSWTATEAATPPAPEPEPPAPAAPPSAAQPPGPAPNPAPALTLTMTKAAKSLKGGKLVVWAGCDRACAVLVKGHLKATAGKAHRGAKVHAGKSGRYREGSQKLKVPVPAKLRHWLETATGKRKLTAKLTLTASDPAGAGAKVKRKLKLHPPPRR